MENKRVLVVDDEPEVTFALQVFFLGKGYEMLTALDGLQAMKILQQHPVHLVLLDMKMPGVNGIEVLKYIRGNAPSTKVIVVTAYDLQFQDLVEQIGVDGFLMKPFGIQALTQTIESVLSGSPPQPASLISESVPSEGAVLPKARLLFVEPSEYTYKVKEIFFSDSEKSGGVYETDAVYSADEVLPKLESFRPDILLVELSLLGQAGDLTVRVMRSSARPRELILHGSGSMLSHQGPQMDDLSRLGVKIIQNESFTRAGLVRLGEVIRKTAIEQGLIQQNGSG